jgi:DNA-binding transcriptional LysR family regulator
LDIHQLEVLLAAMESPTMTRAEEKVSLSPPAVSLQLHGLASELRTELFVRLWEKADSNASRISARRTRQVTG